MPDSAQDVPVEKTFTATGYSAAVKVRGLQPVCIQFGVGTVTVERSTDEGEHWGIVKKPDFTDLSFSDGDGNQEFNLFEPGEAALYRFHCSAYTSGNIYCRIGNKHQA